MKRQLLLLVMLCGFLSAAWGDTFTVSFQVTNLFPDTNTIILFANPSSGFLNATFSLYDGSNNLIATTPLNPQDGYFVGFGPSSDISGIPVGAVVDNVGSLFPLNSTAYIVIQTTGTANIGNVQLAGFSLTNGSGGGENWTVYSITHESAAPEPGTLVLLGSGFVGLGGILRRKFIG